MNRDKKNLQEHDCVFNTLKKNITSIYKKAGQTWISQLHAIVDLMCINWKLNDIKPVDNMTYHFVAKASSSLHQKVVLKIGCDKKALENERQALTFFDGNGAVKLLDFNEEYNAILIEQAIPGYSLKSIYLDHLDEAIDAYSKTIHKLHHSEISNNYSFPHISDWLDAIDNASKDKMPKNLIEKAVSLKNKLLSTISKEKLLHGDLHHDNILQHGNEWIIIDPKGVIGDVEFEAAAFDFISTTEFAACKNPKETMLARIEYLAKKSSLNQERLIDWVYVRLILMAAWMVEDNGDPAWPINLAKVLYEE